MNENLEGALGGAWSEETHLTLHAKNFNYGLAKYIVDKIKPVDFLEFGSGLGLLAAFLNQHLNLKDSYCIEPNQIKGEYGGKVHLLPLNIFTNKHPDAINKKFDLVMSVEVAEHIERDKHDELFDFLVAHTSKWIVFSGARIGQGGHGHIAEREEQDWKCEFLKRGMEFQKIMSREIREACDKKNINHRQNLMVFKRPDEYLELDKIEKKSKPYLNEILSIVQEKSSFLDGGLYYVNLTDAVNAMPVDSLKEKRKNLMDLAKDRQNILEIGFNAGHSALIFLLVNQESKLTIIDTCQHKYTKACFDYLSQQFPGRLKLIQGDSTVVIDELKNEKFDCVHYDGGKDKTIYKDLLNSISLVSDDHILIIDDTQNQALNEIVIDLEKQDLLDFDKYRCLNDRTKQYRWKHAIAVFKQRPEDLLILSVLNDLQDHYDHSEFPSLYTNNDNVSKITGFARANSLVEILKSCDKNGIQGDFVECGVAGGHSSMIAALTLLQLGDESRELYLYDTYSGFDFELLDENDYQGKSIRDYDLSKYSSDSTSVSKVYEKLVSTGIQPGRLKLIKGMVEETVPQYLPEKISVLRLDVDLYQPTLHCLRMMYPRLEKGGYLIIDDYGHWEGCKKAVHEFFQENGLSVESLEYIDYTCRIYRK